MKKALFDELLASVREGGAILRGEAPPAGTYSVADPDVAEVRGIYGLSQTQFAALLGISVRTLQNWEQHRRRPEGPARVLLRVAARHPEAVLDVVRERPAEAGRALAVGEARPAARPAQVPKRRSARTRKTEQRAKQREPGA